MNAYHTLTVGDVGITLDISLWEDNASAQTYDYQLQCNGRGFSIDRRLRQIGQQRIVVVDFESFIDPNDIQQIELEALGMFVEHWNKYDKILVLLGSDLVKCWHERTNEHQIEELVRRKLKLLEE